MRAASGIQWGGIGGSQRRRGGFNDASGLAKSKEILLLEIYRLWEALIMRLAWLTDIHLNFVGWRGAVQLFQSIREASPDAVLLGGDIAEAPTVVHYLSKMAEVLDIPVYFVLGNHDFYRGSISGVRKAVSDLCARTKRLHWLNETGIVRLTECTALLGHDGWADGRNGDYARSEVQLNDYHLIYDFIGLGKDDRHALMRKLAEEAADHCQRMLPEVLHAAEETILLTHVPPFREACWHMGEISNDDYLPHFSNNVVGEALLDIMRKHLDRRLTVLCGHTHSSGTVELLPNMIVHTGAAAYGRPVVQRMIDVA